MHPTSDDRRRQGQEQFLAGVTLVHQPFTPYRPGWDHEHCAFCGSKFSASGEDLRAGYATLDRYHWVCDTCFHDFSEELGWTT